MAALNEGERVVLRMPRGDARNEDTATVVRPAGGVGQYVVETDSRYLDSETGQERKTFVIDRVYLERTQA
jgi:hypothetical protein